jgi:hypothetical protein
MTPPTKTLLERQKELQTLLPTLRGTRHSKP